MKGAGFASRPSSEICYQFQSAFSSKLNESPDSRSMQRIPPDQKIWQVQETTSNIFQSFRMNADHHDGSSPRLRWYCEFGDFREFDAPKHPNLSQTRPGSSVQRTACHTSARNLQMFCTPGAFLRGQPIDNFHLAVSCYVSNSVEFEVMDPF